MRRFPTIFSFSCCVRGILALALAIGLAACSYQSVRHLERQPWAVNETGELQLKFWTFRYRAVPMNDSFGIQGVAYPVTDNIPAWADYIDELWLAVYVCDSQGRVVADDVRVFIPRTLESGKGVPFEFILRPERLEPGQLYVTFGYRMMLAEGPPPESDLTTGPGEPSPKELGEEESVRGDHAGHDIHGKDRRVFFASESALTRI